MKINTKNVAVAILIIIVMLSFAFMPSRKAESKDSKKPTPAVYDFAVIGLWEKRCSEGFQGWHVKIFDTEKDAIEYLDENEAKGLIDKNGKSIKKWGYTIQFFGSSSRPDYDELVFHGLYRLGDKIPIKKKKVPVELYKEKWVKE